MTAGSPQVRAAALIRADIRRAVEDGALGELPDGISFSVGANNLRATPGVIVSVYYLSPGWGSTGEYAALRQRLMEIAGRHWQPPVPGGFTDVILRGDVTPDEDLLWLVGPPSARGDIPGRRREGR
jgi:hypothetical protein